MIQQVTLIVRHTSLENTLRDLLRLLVRLLIVLTIEMIVAILITHIEKILIIQKQTLRLMTSRCQRPPLGILWMLQIELLKVLLQIRNATMRCFQSLLQKICLQIILTIINRAYPLLIFMFYPLRME